MTTKQKDTVSRLTKVVERLNGKQTVSVNELRKGHISLDIFNVRDKVDFIRTTTFVSVDINTNGKVVKGFVNEYSPKEKTVFPYIN
jgi:hypothetical protein